MEKKTILYICLAIGALILVELILYFIFLFPDPKDAKFLNECVEAHNKVRKLHGSPPLELSTDISSYAKDWSENLAKTNTFKHRQGGKYGENLFMGYELPNLCEAATNAWYNEIKVYDYNEAKFTMGTGHFTQVVWKKTKLLGCGVGKSGKQVYVTCNYEPPGNYMGAFKENVPPLLSGGGGSKESEAPADGRYKKLTGSKEDNITNLI